MSFSGAVHSACLVLYAIFLAACVFLWAVLFMCVRQQVELPSHAASSSGHNICMSTVGGPQRGVYCEGRILRESRVVVGFRTSVYWFLSKIG